MRVVEFRRVQVKRDMDLIREILLRVEADPTLNGSIYKAFDASEFSGRSQEEIVYHIDLLIEDNLVIGIRDHEESAISRLTSRGHDFVADIKDPSIWANVKERVKGLPGLTIMLVWEIAKAELRKKLGLP
jgi:hypothetical protein